MMIAIAILLALILIVLLGGGEFVAASLVIGAVITVSIVSLLVIWSALGSAVWYIATAVTIPVICVVGEIGRRKEKAETKEQFRQARKLSNEHAKGSVEREEREAVLRQRSEPIWKQSAVQKSREEQELQAIYAPCSPDGDADSARGQR